MKSHRLPRIAAFVVLILCLVAPGAIGVGTAGARPAWPDQVSLVPLLTSFVIGGTALHVAVQNSNNIWFTLPAQDAIGHLVIAADGTYQVFATTLSADSGPYDLVYAADAIWFTEDGSGRIGRLPLNDGEPWEFTLPLGAHPHGIDALVQAGKPLQIWFTEAGANALGQLIYNGLGNVSFKEYLLPVALDPSWANAHPEGVTVRSEDQIWFTAPDSPTPRFAFLRPSAYESWLARAFPDQPLGVGSRPWRIQRGSATTNDDYWIVDRGRQRLLHYAPSTLSDWIAYYPSTANSDPQDVALWPGHSVFLSEAGAGRVGKTADRTQPEVLKEFGVIGSSPAGLAVDGNTGCAWAADAAQNRLLRWCPPYFNFSYLPLVARSSS